MKRLGELTAILAGCLITAAAAVAAPGPFRALISALLSQTGAGDLPDDAPALQDVYTGPPLGGPGAFGNGIVAGKGSASEHETDLVLSTASGEVAFTRYFTSSPGDWKDPALPNRTTRPNVIAAPFGTGAGPDTIFWSHSFYQRVVQFSNYVGYAPNRNLEDYYLFRDGTGEVVTFGVPPSSYYLPDGEGQTSHTRVTYVDGGVIVQRRGDGRYYFSALSSLARLKGPWYLTRAEDERYVDAGTGRVRYLVDYAIPNACSDAGTTAYVSTVRTPEGSSIILKYADAQSQCRLTGLDLGLPDGGVVRAVRYGYAGPQLTDVTYLLPDAGVENVLSYSYGSSPNSELSVYSNGRLDSRRVFVSDAGTVASDQRSSGPEMTLWTRGAVADLAECTFAQSFGTQTSCGFVPFYSTTQADGKGNGVAVTVQHSHVFRQTAHGAQSPPPSDIPGKPILASIDACVGGDCTATPRRIRQWFLSRSSYGQWFTSSSKDARGFFTIYNQVPAATGLASGEHPLEVQTVLSGATDVLGSNALKRVDYTYEYLGQGSGPQTYDQYVKTATERSSISSGQTAQTVYRHNPVTNRITAAFRTGWTLQPGSETAVQKTIGTFFFTKRACNGGAEDPLGRTLEVHGPCYVNNISAADCPANTPMPLRQTAYYGATGDTRANRIASWVVSTQNLGSGNCATSSTNSLTTQFLDYDARGRLLRSVDNAGLETRYVYDGSFLVAKEVGISSPRRWSYRYEDGKIASTQRPDGMFDVTCYREGSANGCAGGTLRSQPQWRVLAFDALGTQWRSKTVYTYLNGRVRTESSYSCAGGPCTSGGQLRRNVVHESDPFGRGTYTQTGEGLGSFTDVALFDLEDQLTGVGSAFRQPPPLCGGPVGSTSAPASTSCDALTRDGLGRLTALQIADSGTLCTGYDPRGKPSSVGFGNAACTSLLEQAQYKFDDFGRLVRLTAPWLDDGSGGGPGVIQYDYDSRGLITFKQTPEMRAGGDSLVYAYDASGRLLSLTHQGPSVTEVLFGYEYDRYSSGAPCSATQPLTLGRVARLYDSFGSTWYTYNEFGEVTAELRARSGTSQVCSPGGAPSWSTASCLATADDVHPSTFYHYTSAGLLDGIRYPHGRVVRFTYEGPHVSSVQADLLLGGTCIRKTLIEKINWDSLSSISSYQVDSPESASQAGVEYLRSGDGSSSLPTACGFGRLAPSGATGRVTDFWVSSGALNPASPSGAGDIFQRRFQWNADHLAGQASCLLAAPGFDSPRVEVYASADGTTGYDRSRRLLHASRPGGAQRFSVTGGPFGRRDYQYDGLGNRTFERADCWSFSGKYENAAHPDWLTTYQSVDSPPNPIGPSPSCAASPYLTHTFGYDRDGKIVSIRAPNDGSGQPAHSESFATNVNGQAALGGVYRSITVNGGATYDYWYDATGRRRAKIYPLGGMDETFYGPDNAMLEDRGLASSGPQSPSANKPIDEYVYLDGMPVLVIRGQFSSTWTRLSDASSGQCTRNNETSKCGVYFIINDFLPKPTLLLDSNLLVAGAADYDPFGHPSRVVTSGRTQHPYSAGSTVLGYFLQPPRAPSSSPARPGLSVQIRAKFALVDADPAYASAKLTDDFNRPLFRAGTTTLATPITGRHGGGLTTDGLSWLSDWVEVPANGRVRVVFSSDAPGGTYSGIALTGYEYRRFQTGAVPTWIPVRLPGQYYDQESDLVNNWNRFYSPSLGRYLQPDGIWRYPEQVVSAANAGTSFGVYAYARSNPLVYSDRDGNYAYGPAAIKATVVLCVAQPELCGFALAGLGIFLGALELAEFLTLSPEQKEMFLLSMIEGFYSPDYGATTTDEKKDPSKSPDAQTQDATAQPPEPAGGSGKEPPKDPPATASAADEPGGKKGKREDPRTTRKRWEQATGQEWPKDASGRNQDVSHKTAVADGGGNEAGNVQPKPHAQHMQEHMERGDFSRWSREAAARRAAQRNSGGNGGGNAGNTGNGTEPER